MFVKFKVDHMHGGAWYEGGKLYEVEKKDVASIDPNDFIEVDGPNDGEKVLKAQKAVKGAESKGAPKAAENK